MCFVTWKGCCVFVLKGNFSFWKMLARNTTSNPKSNLMLLVKLWCLRGIWHNHFSLKEQKTQNFWLLLFKAIIPLDQISTLSLQALLSKPKDHSCCDWKSLYNIFFLQNYKGNLQIDFNTTEFRETKLHTLSVSWLYVTKYPHCWMLLSDLVALWRMLWEELRMIHLYQLQWNVQQCCTSVLRFLLRVPWSSYHWGLETF